MTIKVYTAPIIPTGTVTTAELDPTIPVSAFVNDSGYLSVETDPLFTAWNRTDGITITESQITDFQSYSLVGHTHSFESVLDAAIIESISTLATLNALSTTTPDMGDSTTTQYARIRGGDSSTTVFYGTMGGSA